MTSDLSSKGESRLNKEADLLVKLYTPLNELTGSLFSVLMLSEDVSTGDDKMTGDGNTSSTDKNVKVPIN